MALKITNKKQVKVAVEIDGEEVTLCVHFRPLTRKEVTEFRGIGAAHAALLAASEADKPSLASLGSSSELEGMFELQAVRSILDILDVDGEPVEFDNGRWRDMNDDQRLEAKMNGLNGVVRFIYELANNHAEARLLGK